MGKMTKKCPKETQSDLKKVLNSSKILQMANNKNKNYDKGVLWTSRSKMEKIANE